MRRWGMVLVAVVGLSLVAAVTADAGPSAASRLARQEAKTALRIVQRSGMSSAQADRLDASLNRRADALQACVDRATRNGTLDDRSIQQLIQLDVAASLNFITSMDALHAPLTRTRANVLRHRWRSPVGRHVRYYAARAWRGLMRAIEREPVLSDDAVCGLVEDLVAKEPTAADRLAAFMTAVQPLYDLLDDETFAEGTARSQTEYEAMLTRELRAAGLSKRQAESIIGKE